MKEIWSWLKWLRCFSATHHSTTWDDLYPWGGGLKYSPSFASINRESLTVHHVCPSSHHCPPLTLQSVCGVSRLCHCHAVFCLCVHFIKYRLCATSSWSTVITSSFVMVLTLVCPLISSPPLKISQMLLVSHHYDTHAHTYIYLFKMHPVFNTFSSSRRTTVAGWTMCWNCGSLRPASFQPRSATTANFVWTTCCMPEPPASLALTPFFGASTLNSTIFLPFATYVSICTRRRIRRDAR